MKVTFCKTEKAFKNAGKGAVLEVIYKEKTMGFDIKCPGCNNVSYLPVDDEKSGWKVIQALPKLTLNPSIFHTKEKLGCGWHGWIRDGEWLPC